MDFYFTLTSNEKLKEISTPVTIACGDDYCDITSRPQHSCNAIWDTGATSSMISRRIAEQLKLHSIGKAHISGVHGVVETDIYIIDIVFGNGFTISGLRVSEADNGGGFDVLIGMDVIGHGRLIVDGTGEMSEVFFAFPADN